jgi:hypothetical protein
MEFAMRVRPMMEDAIQEHIKKSDLQMACDAEIYMERILPTLTLQVFETVMNNPLKIHSYTAHITEKTSTTEGTTVSLVIKWVHPIAAGYGPGYFKMTVSGADARMSSLFSSRIAVSVQEKVRTHLRSHGWTCWWTDDCFCFQDSVGTEKVKEGMRLFASYRVEGADEVLFAGSDC